jgi:hypothetical protein
MRLENREYVLSAMYFAVCAEHTHFIKTEKMKVDFRGVESDLHPVAVPYKNTSQDSCKTKKTQLIIKP